MINAEIPLADQFSMRHKIKKYIGVLPHPTTLPHSMNGGEHHHDMQEN